MRALSVLMVLTATAAFAQHKVKKTADAPTPYSDQEQEEDRDRRDLPSKSDATRERPQEQQIESKDREVSLASLDDPNIGISVEVVLNTVLLQSSRGAGIQSQFGVGARFTWEWSRTLLSDEFWREVFFLDATYIYSADSLSISAQENTGTSREAGVHDNAHYNYFTLAQAFAWPLGHSPISAYLQIGGGISYQTSTVIALGNQTDVSATRFLLQYGGGFRFRIPVLSDAHIQENQSTEVPRVSFRVEFTRLRRGYRDDTVVGGSLGMTF